MFSIQFDEAFANLIVRGLRKLPVEEVESALSGLIKELNRQKEAMKQADEVKEEEKPVEVV